MFFTIYRTDEKKLNLRIRFCSSTEQRRNYFAFKIRKVEKATPDLRQIYIRPHEALLLTNVSPAFELPTLVFPH